MERNDIDRAPSVLLSTNDGSHVISTVTSHDCDDDSDVIMDNMCGNNSNDVVDMDNGGRSNHNNVINNSDDNDDSESMMDEEELEQFEAFVMRFKCTEHPFTGILWPCLRECGWTYHPSSHTLSGSLYQWSPSARATSTAEVNASDSANNGIVNNSNNSTPRNEVLPSSTSLSFESSIEVTSYLDRFALPDVLGNLQYFPPSEQEQHGAPNVNNAAERELGIRLRRQVLKLVYERLLKQQDKNEKSKSDRTTNKNDHGTVDDGKDRRRAGCNEDVSSCISRRQPRRACTALTMERIKSSSSSVNQNCNHHSKDKSVTAIEKGTDLYLHKKGRGGGGGKLSKAVSSAKVEQQYHNNSSENAKLFPTGASTVATDECPPSIMFPSIDECSQYVARMNKKKNNHNDYDDGNDNDDDGNDNQDEDDPSVASAYEEYEQDFMNWRFLLSTNHSILLFGAGSKLDLLNSFADNELSKEGYVVTINGYNNDVSITGILDLLVDLFLDGIEPPATSSIAHYDIGYDNDDATISTERDGVISSAIHGNDISPIGTYNPWRTHPTLERSICVSRAIAYKCTETLIPIFLVIHNLDGIPFRNDLAQIALGLLLINSTVENGVASIRLVASMDHVDTQVRLWSSSSFIATNLNFIMKEVHTHQLYSEELAMIRDEEYELGQQSSSSLNANKKKVNKRTISESNANRFFDILKTLAPRHTEATQILAGLQLEHLLQVGTTTTVGGSNKSKPNNNKSRKVGGRNDNDDGENGGGGWVEYKKFLDACRTKLIVNKDAQLRTFVGELVDHALVKTMMGDTSEYLCIPYYNPHCEECVTRNSVDSSYNNNHNDKRMAIDLHVSKLRQIVNLKQSKQ